jgi:hypothetical protein
MEATLCNGFKSISLFCPAVLEGGQEPGLSLRFAPLGCWASLCMRLVACGCVLLGLVLGASIYTGIPASACRAVWLLCLLFLGPVDSTSAGATLKQWGNSSPEANRYSEKQQPWNPWLACCCIRISLVGVLMSPGSGGGHSGVLGLLPPHHGRNGRHGCLWCFISQAISSLGPGLVFAIYFGYWTQKERVGYRSDNHQRLLSLSEKVHSCDQERQSALEEAQQNPREGIVIPECAPGGLYKPVQCHQSTGYCWCVLVDTGRPLPGTSTR